VTATTAFDDHPSSDREVSGDRPLPDQEVFVSRLRSLGHGQTGQTTAEYALVLLVAAVIVGVFATFAKSGALTDMFQQVVSSLVERAAG
jgi:Flp pilus assembly pilin Flp